VKLLERCNYCLCYFHHFSFPLFFFSFLPTNILIELYISFVNVKDLLDWWLHLSRLHCFCETESIRLTAVFSYLEISNELISNPDLQDPVLYLDRYMEQSIIHWYSERLNTFDVKF